MSETSLTNLLPHLRALSEYTQQFVLAEQVPELDDRLYIDVFYAGYRGAMGTVARKWSDWHPSVLLVNGVVMASRGLDNVTDVCEAMRADLARRNGGQS
jgi:hypothetical protein